MPIYVYWKGETKIDIQTSQHSLEINACINYKK